MNLNELKKIRKLSLLFALLLLSSLQSARGQTIVKLQESESRNLVFTGYIDADKPLPVTICLNVANMSSGHRDWYSVSGWFQHVGEGGPKLPLAGIKTSGLLRLYYFKDPALADTLTNFLYDDYEQYGFWEMINHYHEMGGFLERMTFEDIMGKLEDSMQMGRGIKGEWTDGRLHLPISVYSSKLDVLRYNSILKISHKGKDFYVDLYTLSLPLFYPGEHTVIGYKAEQDKVRVVLSYERASKAYALGACGAGNEDGFLSLELDDEGHLLQLEDFRITSCLEDINYEQGYKNDKQENYIVTDSKSTRMLHFDKENMQLKWQTKK